MRKSVIDCARKSSIDNVFDNVASDAIDDARKPAMTHVIAEFDL